MALKQTLTGQAASAAECPLTTPLAAMPLDRPLWHSKVEALELTVARARQAPVVFLGDSLTERWPADLWRRHFAPLGAINLGVGADLSSSLLWRLRQRRQGPALAAWKPRSIILLIGTNDIAAGRKPADIAGCVGEIVRQIGAYAPSSAISLLSVLPRLDRPGFNPNIDLLNAALAACRLRNTRYVDVRRPFEGADKHPLFVDGIHLSRSGYQLLLAQLSAQGLPGAG